jgi:glycosyltransferase involved in cell wall biosynthesis
MIPAVVILTFNESANIARTLGGVAWAREIVVLDSGSSDDTREIAARHPAVRVVQRPFTSHAEQWNFAVHETGITSEWILALDADFVVSGELAAEIQAIDPPAGTNGYWASFVYCIDGRPLRGAAYPPVAVLYRRAAARYAQDGHTQRVRIDGHVGNLRHRLHHDDRKPLSHWLAAQSRYMRLESEKLLATPRSELAPIDRLRLALIVMPPAMFVYCYLLRGGVLDGMRGLFYAMQRAGAETILSMYLIERRLFGRRPAGD